MAEIKDRFKKPLWGLIQTNIKFSVALDKVMKLPESRERGEKIAALLNRLDANTQAALHFAFDYSFKRIDNLYKKLGG